jgi:hypothetical protein
MVDRWRRSRPRGREWHIPADAKWGFRWNGATRTSPLFNPARQRSSLMIWYTCERLDCSSESHRSASSNVREVTVIASRGDRDHPSW